MGLISPTQRDGLPQTRLRVGQPACADLRVRLPELLPGVGRVQFDDATPQIDGLLVLSPLHAERGLSTEHPERSLPPLFLDRGSLRAPGFFEALTPFLDLSTLNERVTQRAQNL